MSFLTQKLIWTKIKLLYIPDEKSHGLGVEQEACQKIGLLPTILVKESRHSENIEPKYGTPTSIVARVVDANRRELQGRRLARVFTLFPCSLDL